MKKTSQTLLSIVFVISFSSIAFCDPTSAITSLVGRNAELYLAPIGTMLGTNMNSGYFRQAKPHKILGFDLTLDLTYSIAPPGETTYEFVIPDDEVDFSIPFTFPKGLLTVPTADLGLIKGADGTFDPSPESLYKDQIIPFILTVDDLLDPPTGPAQNIFGCTTPVSECGQTLNVTYDSAAVRIYEQVIAMTWEQIKGIEGIGTPMTYTSNGIVVEVPAKYKDAQDFKDDFKENIEDGILEGMESLPDLSLPIPTGSAGYFPISPIGLPLPILQGSIGLPFHTEVTFRGIFTPMEIPDVGTIKYGGIGGKIGISEYLSDILYKSENELRASKLEDMQYVIDAQPADIKPKDVSKAINYLRLHEMDIYEIDSLNILYVQGDTVAVIEIQNRMLDAQLQLEAMPKLKIKKKQKKFPIDLSLGFYTNDFILDLESTEDAMEGAGDGQAKINSTNKMISLQASKTLNLPSFLAFLGGIGIYGGLGFEWSNLDLEYILTNPMAYGCFVDDTYTETTSTGIDYTQGDCTGAGKEWKSGVPTPIALSFPGENKFRKLIGVRTRILFLDLYADYNFGASNAYNLGLGITIR